ncbi:MAG: class I SAM-dependent methyltransferase [Gemmatimonadales bacterium]|nr:class I SAM-dependent methyltransferase [Gemmatimonadales bacterium]
MNFPRKVGHVSREFTDQLTWEEKARLNPLWAVMSVDEFAQAGSDPSSWEPEQLALFFQKGRMLFEVFLRPALERAGLDPERTLLLEYGSGMGRILQAVRKAGYRCAGVDISRTMLDHSRELVPDVRDLHLLGPDGRVPLPDGVADYVYSYAVLQHIPHTSLLQRAIREMCRVLKPGGLLRIQFQPGSMPFGSRPYAGVRAINFEHRSLVFRWARLQNRWRVPGWIPRMPVVRLQRHNHWSGVPLRWQTMRDLLRAGGVRLLSLERDPVADWNSVWLLGKKDLSV